MKRVKKIVHIENSMDVLLTLVVFYAITRWGLYETLITKILGFYVCIVVINDWLQVRESYLLSYRAKMVFQDLIVAFCYANLPNALLQTNYFWGYNPIFWLWVAISEFVYAVWDLDISRLSEEGSPAKPLMRIWTYMSLLSTFLAAATFIVQTSKLLPEWIGHAFGFITAGYILWMTIRWNWQRYKITKKENSSFIS